MPDSVDFTDLRSRFDIYTSNPNDGGTLITSGSFNQNGHWEGQIRIATYLEEIYVSTIAGDVIVSLSTNKQKDDGIIIDFGGDYGYTPPDTIEPTNKSFGLSFEQELQNYNYYEPSTT